MTSSVSPSMLAGHSNHELRRLLNNRGCAATPDWQDAELTALLHRRELDDSYLQAAYRRLPVAGWQTGELSDDRILWHSIVCLDQRDDTLITMMLTISGPGRPQLAFSRAVCRENQQSRILTSMSSPQALLEELITRVKNINSNSAIIYRLPASGIVPISVGQVLGLIRQRIQDSPLPDPFGT